MKAQLKIAPLALIFLVGTDNLMAAKPDPALCPCYAVMVDLVAEASCTDIWDFSKEGRGKDGWTRNLIWINGDSCTRLNVSAASSRVDAFMGDASGLAVCDVTGDRCRVSELTEAEVDACNRILRVAKRDVQKLPDCD